ncbi:MAG: helix-turn-helix domain-containing protein [Gordonia sp. (in: high G+C Gram-positive bacteria)]
MTRDPRVAAVLISPDALLFQVSVPMNVFGIDHSEFGGPALRAIPIATGPDETVDTTGGLRLGGLAKLSEAQHAGVVIVPTWADPATPPGPAVIETLREAESDGATVMGLCLGAYALAYAGLLDGRRALTHWHWQDDFTRRFPAIHSPDSRVPDSHSPDSRAHDSAAAGTGLYIDEGRIITSAGAAAGIDACLHYVRREWGAAAAAAIAKRMVVAPHRSGTQRQFTAFDLHRPGESGIGSVQERALAHPIATVTVPMLVRWYGTSRRTFDRDFRAATGQSPLQWLIYQRVLTAQRLLETTTLDIEMVANQAGFASAISLRPHFRRALGISPQAYRHSFGATGATRAAPSDRSALR